MSYYTVFGLKKKRKNDGSRTTCPSKVTTQDEVDIRNVDFRAEGTATDGRQPASNAQKGKRKHRRNDAEIALSLR
jgi:midasin (ATPase involved in ribosome maturation)